MRDLGSIPGLGRFPGEGNGNSLQYSCLENPMDGGAWCRLLSMGSQRVGHDWATSLHFTSPSGTHQKEITRCYSLWPCGYECFQWTALRLNDCWVSTVILPWCQVYSKGVFSAKTILYFFYTNPKYLHIDDSLFGLLFSNFTQWFQALTKWFIIFIYILYYFFLSKSEVKSTSESCLPGLVPWEIPEPKLILWGIKKVVTDVFYCS